MLQKSVSQLQHLDSSSNLRKFEQRSSSSMAANVNNGVVKQLRVGQSQCQSSAIPPSKLSCGRLSCLILFNIFNQAQILYFLVISLVLFFNKCRYDLGNLIIQLFMLLFYVGLDVFIRYLTYESFTSTESVEDERYDIWSWSDAKWLQTPINEIKVGHLIRLHKKERHYGENAIKVPVNLLPIMVDSGKKQIIIDTFENDKTQSLTTVEIIPQFEREFTSEHSIDPRIQNIRIQYTFHNPNSQSFQAKILFPDIFYKKTITNNDAILKGAFVQHEEYLIGVVLFNEGNNIILHLLRVLNSKNSVDDILRTHLLKSAFAFILVTFVYLVIILFSSSSFLMDCNDPNRRIACQYFYCGVLNVIGIVHYSLSIFMFVQLSWHRLIQSYCSWKKFKVNMKNYIKSIDEFGIADTFVMDEFSFIEKNVLKLGSILINEGNQFTIFDRNTILYIAHSSHRFKERAHQKWQAITFKLIDSHAHVIIEEQITDFDGSILMVVSVRNNSKSERYLIKFSQKIILSVLESISISQQIYFWSKIEEAKKKGELMMMMQITPLSNSFILGEFNCHELGYHLHCLISFNFTVNDKAINFIRQVKNKYNILIMTENKIDDFQKILMASNLKRQNDKICTFEETDDIQFKNELKQLFSQLIINKNANQKSTILSNVSYRYILAFDASLIAYLSRQDIQKLMIKSADLSLYVIFYNCTQFQKQLCAASLFRIFPQHIFISNFAIDINIFRSANLSACIAGNSSERYVTAIATSYQSLRAFVTKESVGSIWLTTIIIKNNIFKNQTLIFSLLIVELLVEQGGIVYVGEEFSSFLFLLYNFAFTILPMFYYILGRPKLIEDIVVDDYKDYKLVNEHAKGAFSGLMMTTLTFLLIPQTDMHNIFTALLINCTTMGNLHYLVVDDSVSKRTQIMLIIAQMVISLSVYLLTLFFVPDYSIFYINFDVSISSRIQENWVYLLVVFCIGPVVIVLWFYFISFKKSIQTREERRQVKEKQLQQSQNSISREGVRIYVGKSIGKQMRFRGNELRQNEILSL